MSAYKKKDGYYRKAKEEGYRSRAYYKIKQIDQRFDVIDRQDVVLDLGAAPGSWSQYALEQAGEGNVLAVDLQRMRDLEGASFYQGDVTDGSDQQRIAIIAGDVDVILSDMAPDISGNYSLDHARSIYLARCALELCDRCLKEGGNFVVKVFQGADFDDLLREARERFDFVKCNSPKASRSSSSEMYVICKGYNH